MTKFLSQVIQFNLVLWWTGILEREAFAESISLAFYSRPYIIGMLILYFKNKISVNHWGKSSNYNLPFTPIGFHIHGTWSFLNVYLHKIHFAI